MRSSRRAALLAAVALVIPVGVVVLEQTPAQAAVDFGYGTPTYVNSAAPAFFGAPLAGEPSVGVDWTTGGATGTGMYQAFTDTYKLSFDTSAQPAKITWNDASSPYSIENLDPILATDPTTGVTLAGGDDGPCAVMSRTTDDGASWTPTAPCPFAADHPTVGFGPFAGGTVPLGGSGTRVAYFCQQQVAQMCSRSLDGGTTWTPGTAQLDCLSLFGHVKAAADGTAYVPAADCADANGQGVGGFYTKDNGLTWAGYAIPGAPTPSRGFDPSVATTPDGTLYESWNRDGDFHPVITSTKDVTTGWSPQVDLANTVSPPLVASTFQSVVAGDNGRVAVAYLGTQVGTPGVTPFDSGYHGVWYLYVSTSYDGGSTWTTVRASDEPVQRGSISDGGTTSTGQRNLLDFIDASVTKDGRVLVGYADGCLDTCNGPTGTESQSTNQYATAALQTSGQGLFAAYDKAAPLATPTAPTLTATGGNNAVNLAWNVPSDGGSPLTAYRISRGTGPGAETLLTTVSAGATSYNDTSATPGTAYYYAVSAVNAVGSSPPSNEAAATATTVPSAPTLTAAAGKGTATLSWTTPTSDGGKPITGWAIYRGTAPATETLIQTIGSGTSYVDNTVTGGTTYWYRVAAVNANGPGAQSNEASATPKKGGR